MIQILKVEKSDKPNKKFKVWLSDFKKIYIGIPTSISYIDGATIEKRNAYLKRHFNNPKEAEKIKNFIMSPSLLSYYLTWGPYRNINKNVDYLNELLIKHNKI